jgi:hypothetical protein
MSGGRFHLVAQQNGREFVSPAGISEEDARKLLAVDTLLHRAAGWRVAADGPDVIMARRGDVVRLVSFRRIGGSDDGEPGTGNRGLRVA